MPPRINSRALVLSLLIVWKFSDSSHIALQAHKKEFAADLFNDTSKNCCHGSPPSPLALITISVQILSIPNAESNNFLLAWNAQMKVAILHHQLVFCMVTMIICLFSAIGVRRRLVDTSVGNSVLSFGLISKEMSKACLRLVPHKQLWWSCVCCAFIRLSSLHFIVSLGQATCQL